MAGASCTAMTHLGLSMTEQAPSRSGQALVAIGDRESGPVPYHVVRRQAPFLAHLIAMARQVPQARERRRAEPAEAIAVYRTSLDRLRHR